MLVDSKPNQLTPAICTEWPVLSTIWLPDVLSQPGAVPPPPGLPSTTEVSEMLSVGRGGGGAASSLTMVPLPEPWAMVAPTGFVSVTVKPSLASTVESPIAATVIVFCVSPGAKVSVPDWAT